MRRDLVGIAGISLIAGLWLTYLLIGAEDTEGIRLISSEVPGSFDRSVGARPVFSVGFVVDRTSAGLELSFSVLREAEPSTWVNPEKGWIQEEDLRERPTGIAPLDLWLESANSLGRPTGSSEATARVNGSGLDGHVFDFRSLGATSGATDVIALLFSDGNLIRTFVGRSGFFREAPDALWSLKVEHNQLSEVYSKNPTGEERPLEDLAPRGVLGFEDVEDGDQILVSMVLEGHLVPEGRSWLWVCEAVLGGDQAGVWIFSTM